FWSLGSRRGGIFGERYWARDAWRRVHRGFEVSWAKNANSQLLSAGGGVPTPADAAYGVHPPVGKYVIGLGELIFGFEPFGWRFMTALLGTLSVLMLRSEEHTSELQSRENLVCRLLLEKKKMNCSSNPWILTSSRRIEGTRYM